MIRKKKVWEEEGDAGYPQQGSRVNPEGGGGGIEVVLGVVGGIWGVMTT